MRTDFLVGLDLGQTTDFTALAALERSSAPEADDQYALRHLKRFRLGTSYVSIVEGVADLVRRPELARCALVADQTGVGRPVLDMLYQAELPCRIVPVTITAGHAVTIGTDGALHVPKVHLVGALQVLLQSRRLRVSRQLPEAELLVKELSNFQVKLTRAANEVFGGWREGQHDDLVLAAALAAWYGIQHPPPSTDCPFVVGTRRAGTGGHDPRPPARGC